MLGFETHLAGITKYLEGRKDAKVAFVPLILSIFISTSLLALPFPITRAAAVGAGEEEMNNINPAAITTVSIDINSSMSSDNSMSSQNSTTTADGPPII